MGDIYKSLYRPVFDEVGWDDEVNANFTLLADRTQRAVKSADQSVSTTTFENDNHLILPGLAAGTYLIHGVLFYSRLAGTASLLKIGFLSTDGAAEFQWSSGAPANGNATDLAIGASTTGSAGTGTKSSMEFHGKLILTVTADFRLRWALQSATDTITMFKGSTMFSDKVI